MRPFPCVPRGGVSENIHRENIYSYVAEIKYEIDLLLPNIYLFHQRGQESKGERIYHALLFSFFLSLKIVDEGVKGHLQSEI